MTGRTAAKWGRTVKKLVGKLFVWSISPSRRVFFRDKNRIAFRKEMNCLPQRRNFSAARQFLRVQKEGKNRASEGFSRSGWSPPACKSRLPFCKPFPRGADAGEVPKRMPFRVKQQSVAKIGSRLSSCIPLGARGSHISVLFPSPARLRGSRRGCLDVLTKCHLGTCCRPQLFWRLRDRRRPAPPKQAREFPRAVFLPFPESLEYTAVLTVFLLSLFLSLSPQVPEAD